MVLLIRWRMVWMLVALTVVLGCSALIPPVLRHYFPIRYASTVNLAAETYNIDPYLIFAIIRAESSFNPRARSHKGAIGLMQLMPETAKWVAERMGIEGFHVERLAEPELNIQLGTWYLAMLLDEFQGRLLPAVAAYNGGGANVRRWLNDARWSGSWQGVGDIPFPETRQYVRRVMGAWAWYYRVYKGKFLPDAHPSRQATSRATLKPKPDEAQVFY